MGTKETAGSGGTFGPISTIRISSFTTNFIVSMPEESCAHVTSVSLSEGRSTQMEQLVWEMDDGGAFPRNGVTLSSGTYWSVGETMMLQIDQG